MRNPEWRCAYPRLSSATPLGSEGPAFGPFRWHREGKGTPQKGNDEPCGRGCPWVAYFWLAVVSQIERMGWTVRDSISAWSLISSVGPVSLMLEGWA